MKKIAAALALSATMLFAGSIFAQEKNTVGQDLKNAGKDVGKAGKKVGNKTAEVASKGASKVADQEYKDKAGPSGETVYIDGHKRYYYVDGKGKHVYVKESELIAK